MSLFIEYLESRTLFSGSKANLLADLAVLKDEANGATPAPGLIGTYYADGLYGIARALRGSGRANAALLRSLLRALPIYESALGRATRAFFSPGLALAKRSASTGLSLLKKPTLKLIAEASRDVTALNVFADVPLVNLQSALYSKNFNASLDALAAADPTMSGVSMLIGETKAYMKGWLDSLNTYATSFKTDSAALATDLAAARTAATSFPYLPGNYTGSAFVVTGKNSGMKVALGLPIESESAIGHLAGTLLISGFESAPMTGYVTLAGSFVMKASSLVFTGVFRDNALVGSYRSSTHTGTFEFNREV